MGVVEKGSLFGFHFRWPPRPIPIGNNKFDGHGFKQKCLRLSFGICNQEKIRLLQPFRRKADGPFLLHFCCTRCPIHLINCATIKIQGGRSHPRAGTDVYEVGRDPPGNPEMMNMLFASSALASMRNCQAFLVIGSEVSRGAT